MWSITGSQYRLVRAAWSRGSAVAGYLVDFWCVVYHKQRIWPGLAAPGRGGPLKVCVFGAGAIGGYLRVELARTVVRRSGAGRAAQLAAMCSDGMPRGSAGEEHVPPRLWREPTPGPGVPSSGPHPLSVNTA